MACFKDQTSDQQKNPCAGGGGVIEFSVKHQMSEIFSDYGGAKPYEIPGGIWESLPTPFKKTLIVQSKNINVNSFNPTLL
jgi:hypothetical protein